MTMDNDSIADTLAAKSDQLNADDLIGGPITVTVIGWKRGATKEQPVWLSISDDRMPYSPCKSMRRVLAEEWGDRPSEWVGRSMTLYRDPNVMFGGVRVGGIRISHLSHMKQSQTEHILTVAKAGKKAPFTVRRLDTAQPQQQSAPSHEVTGDALKQLFDRVGSHAETKEEKEAIYRGFGVTGPIGKPSSWTRQNIAAGHQWCDQMKSGN
jgi:hypothetical protein